MPPERRSHAGPYGARGMPPEGIHQAEEPAGSENAWPVNVRIETPADHFALRHIAVDVPAEQRRHDEDGDGPGDRHGDHGPTGVPGCLRSVRTISNHDPIIRARPA